MATTLPAASTQAAIGRTIEHVVRAIDAAPAIADPFAHLQLAGVFPDDLYAEMMEAMPDKRDYRRMSGRARSMPADGGEITRTKLDLLPEFIRHLPETKRGVWTVVGRALCSPEVREAFRRRLAPGLEKRFGAGYREVGMYPIPILTRDVPGYRIGIHPDTRRKAMTIQLYLPRDRSIEHVGTVFHRRGADKTYERAAQMSFSPNVGYAFAVGANTYHSVDPVGSEVRTRDSILLTYFVDDSFAQVLHNRGKRVGNFLLNEIRSLAR
ncbi:MAG TPA: hypothetical protein VFE23_14220 [Usitatibacter sp.]|jgi:hypothetical protein|nr:hypothetical protein [Usitatibacter sp.]